MPAKNSDGDSTTSTRLRRPSNCSERLRTKRGQCCVPGMSSRSADIIWQPLHTPSENVSGRAKNALKRSRSARVEQDRLRPAFAGAEHVAVREAAAHDQAAEVVEAAGVRSNRSVMCTSYGDEAGAMERRRHLDVTVDALLAQDRDLRPRALGDVRRGDVLLRLERQPRRSDPDRSGSIAAANCSRAHCGIVAQLDHAEARLGPRAAQCRCALRRARPCRRRESITRSAFVTRTDRRA